MGDPDVLSNQKEYNRLAKEYANQGPLAHKAQEYVSALDDLEAAKEMLADADTKDFAQEEIADIEARLPELEEEIKFMLIPADPADDKDIIVEIRAAAGGDEAAIFAGDLYRMYERFASSQGWKTETLDVSASEAGGYKEISFKVTGDKVYSVMKFESGVHRVQRVPKTESQGRIHTSTATICALMYIVQAVRVDNALIRLTQRFALLIFQRAWSCNPKIRNRSYKTKLPLWLYCVLVCMKRCSQNSRPLKVLNVLRRLVLGIVQKRFARITDLKIA